MDVSDLVNSDITFSKATTEDILTRYSVKQKNSTSTVNATPATVKTALSTLNTTYARVHGSRPDDDYGDFTWLTLENLQKPSKFLTARPLFEGAAHPNASESMSVPLEASSVRKSLENLRSVLYAAAQHLKTLDMDDNERKTLLQKYNESYQDFGKLSAELMDDENKRLLTRSPSQRQKSKWVTLPYLRKALKTVVTYLDQTFANPPATMNVTDNKKLQRSMHFAMSMLIPPERNDWSGLRFITEAQESGENIKDILRETNSPNYVLLKDDGTVELVINKYKMDRRSQAMNYDDSVDFEINTPTTKRFPLSENNAVLTKFGFAPVKCGQLLTGYRALQQSLLGDKNPHDLVFFEIKRNQPVSRMSSDGMSTRMGRITERLVGQSLGPQMFRTITVSWFNNKRPTMAEREVIADWMMHDVKTQMGTYTKNPSAKKRSPVNLTGSGAKRQRLTVKNMKI